MGLRIVVIGASLGGLNALRVLLTALPANFQAAMIIVLHRGKEETGELLPFLQATCQLPISFPLDKEIILPGHIYFAPPNYHLLVEDDHFSYTLDAPVDYARPSINMLFESAAEACRSGVIGIILTGTKEDGARGLLAIQNYGGLAIVQAPEEATAPQMPLAALAMVPNAQQLTLKAISEWLIQEMSYD